MRKVSYTDRAGRQWATLLPDGIPDSDASTGLPLGPPSLEDLGLPKDIEVRLHNLLFERGIFTFKDAHHRGKELRVSLGVALRVNVNKLMEVYKTTAEQV